MAPRLLLQVPAVQRVRGMLVVAVVVGLAGVVVDDSLAVEAGGGARDAPALRIDHVGLGGSEEPVLEIVLSGRLADTPHVARLTAQGLYPERIVLDVPGAIWRVPLRIPVGGRGVVTGVRTGTFGSSARVVLDLAAEAIPTLAIDGHVVRLRVVPVHPVVAPTAAVSATQHVEAADDAALAGRFDAALTHLGHAAALGADGEVEARKRGPGVVKRWIAALDLVNDPTAAAIAWSAHGAAFEDGATPADAVRVAEALVQAGLPDGAVQLLARHVSLAHPEIDVALADAALEAQDIAVVGKALERLAWVPLSPPLARRLRRTQVRAALVSGDVDRAAELLAAEPDAELDGDVARGLVAAADSDIREGRSDRARARLRRALALDSSDRMRRVANLGLADVALDRGDLHDATEALVAARATADPLMTRAATALAAMAGIEVGAPRR